MGTFAAAWLKLKTGLKKVSDEFANLSRHRQTPLAGGNLLN
jgi:hypothetical protein